MNAFLQTVWQHPLLESIGWTLTHSLWQGAAIVIPLAIAMRYLHRSSATFRYLAACAALFTLGLCSLLTLTFMIAHSDPVRWHSARSTIVNENETATATAIDSLAGELAKPIESSHRFGSATGKSQLDQAEIGAINWNHSSNSGDATAEINDRLDSFSLARWMPWLSLIWLASVSVLSLRMVGGLWEIVGWRRRGREIVDPVFLSSVQRLSEKLNLTWPIRCLESLEISVPTVIGFWRPVLLVPLGIVSGMTPSELESILAHELAHIRRRDWLVNLLQSIVEILLFYHPAVWWLSAVIRSEREHCCDDIAVRVCGDRLALAKALAQIETARAPATGLAMAASGAVDGHLLRRVQRILTPPTTLPVSKWPAGVLGLLTVALFSSGIWMSVVAAVPARQPSQQTFLLDRQTAEPDQSPMIVSEDKNSVVSVNRRDDDRIMLATEGKSTKLSWRTVDAPDDTPWGQVAQQTGLQSRLTLQTDRPQVGKPLLVKLELRNSGDKPTEFDPQKYAPFRVLRAEVTRPDLPPPFIGLKRQTSGGKITLQPGATKLLWENVDVSELFLLAEEREYQIFAEGGEWAIQNFWRDSNRLRVGLEPGTLSPMHELLFRLTNVVPEGWRVSKAFGKIMINQTDANLKGGIVTVELIFSAEPLDDLTETFQTNRSDQYHLGVEPIYDQRTLKYLGPTPLGHVYLGLWPDRGTGGGWPGYQQVIQQVIDSMNQTGNDNTSAKSGERSRDDDDAKIDWWELRDRESVEQIPASVRSIRFVGRGDASAGALDDELLAALVRRAPRLHHLDLPRAERVSNEGFRALSELTELRALRLRLAQQTVTPEGLKHLISQRQLEVLDLSWCEGVLNDQGLAILAQLPSLKKLILLRHSVGNGISVNGWNALQPHPTWQEALISFQHPIAEHLPPDQQHPSELMNANRYIPGRVQNVRPLRVVPEISDRDYFLAALSGQTIVSE